MPEGLSPAEVSKEIAEHRHEHPTSGDGGHDEHRGSGRGDGEHGHHAGRDRWVTIFEAILLSIVALVAAWSGYSSAQWDSRSSLSLARSSIARTEASVDSIQASQVNTLNSVDFNAVESAYLAHDEKAFHLTVRRLSPTYRTAFSAWLALHPLKNPNAPPDPSYMPQYRVPQQAQAMAETAKADAYFDAAESASSTGDKYVRLTVLLAAVLFLIGIGSRFPVRAVRYGLIAVATVLLVMSVVQLLGLAAPPS